MAPKSDADSVATENCDDCQIDNEGESCTTFDSNIYGNDNVNGDMDSIDKCYAISKDPTTDMDDGRPTLAADTENGVWANEYPDAEIIVTEINRIEGLGISIEGTVEVEYGIEKQPHHFIRSILFNGPVARDGKLKPGDELLQVNEHRLPGLTHIAVVRILKELPKNVRIVCARGQNSPSIINTSQNIEAFESRSIIPGGHLILQGLLKAQSESSLFTSSTNTITDQHRSRSVEQVSGLALWNNDPVYIDIEKTERGFGFSILDYQVRFTSAMSEQHIDRCSLYDVDYILFAFSTHTQKKTRTRWIQRER